MARGTVVGEPVVSQAGTDEFREGYERIFGDRKPQRGRWVWDEAQQKLVRPDEYVAPPAKTGTAIMCDRWMEGTRTLDDGTDIGSRRKLQRYMREKGVTHAADFSPEWYAARKAEQRREANKSRREVIARAVYEKFKP